MLLHVDWHLKKNRWILQLAQVWCCAVWKPRGSAALEEKCKRLASASGEPRIALHTWNIYYRLSSPRQRPYNTTPVPKKFHRSLSNVCLCIATLLRAAQDAIVLGKDAACPHVGGTFCLQWCTLVDGGPARSGYVINVLLYNHNLWFGDVFVLKCSQSLPHLQCEFSPTVIFSPLSGHSHF